MKRAIEPEVVVIGEGSVTLGAPDFPPHANLPHVWSRKNVNVPRFGIARFSVTVGEYLVFAECTGYGIDERLRVDPRFQNPRQPAAYVSWIDATRYAQWLARITGKGYRLVRDAEFEKASRGGLSEKKYPWGDETPIGRCDYNNPEGAPLPVGSFSSNGYGLHDMAGSMWSWCEECFDEVAYPDKAKMSYPDTLIKNVRINPICRGGSYKTTDPIVLFCACRHEDPTEGRFDCIGFRLALSIV
jgi:formylglycine-generating enzyme required for sulfatase activity